MKARIMDRARSFLGDPRRRVLAGAGALAVVAVVAVLVVLLASDGGTSLPSDVEPEGFAIFPQGEEVNRLSP
ncbi:MAG: hypothetical protein L6Q80_13140, partial [Dehalococcoidia bacterium]|nr:hypothetical protein [Dehalococcoidia bacterium]